MKRTPGSEELLESGTVILTFAVTTDVAMIVVVVYELVDAIEVILHSSNMSWSVPGTVQLNFAISLMAKNTTQICKLYFCENLTNHL